jgi:hypothetical protein
MMMRPRRYGALNRSIAKSIGYAINQNYRNNSNNKKTTTNNNSGSLIGIIFLVFIIVLIISAVSK